MAKTGIWRAKPHVSGRRTSGLEGPNEDSAGARDVDADVVGKRGFRIPHIKFPFLRQNSLLLCKNSLLSLLKIISGHIGDGFIASLCFGAAGSIFPRPAGFSFGTVRLKERLCGCHQELSICR